MHPTGDLPICSAISVCLYLPPQLAGVMAACLKTLLQIASIGVDDARLRWMLGTFWEGSSTGIVAHRSPRQTDPTSNLEQRHPLLSQLLHAVVVSQPARPILLLCETLGGRGPAQ